MTLRTLPPMHPGVAMLVLLGVVALWLLLGLVRGRTRWSGRHCRRCGYSLTTSAMTRCSECGCELRGADAATLGRRSWSPARLVALVALAAIAWPACRFVESVVKPRWMLGIGGSDGDLARQIVRPTPRPASWWRGPPLEAGEMRDIHAAMLIDRVDRGEITPAEATELLLAAAAEGVTPIAEPSGWPFAWNSVAMLLIRLGGSEVSPAQRQAQFEALFPRPDFRLPRRMIAGDRVMWPETEVEDVDEWRVVPFVVTRIRAGAVGAEVLPELPRSEDDNDVFQWPQRVGVFRIEFDWEQRLFKSTDPEDAPLAWSRSGTWSKELEFADDGFRPPRIVDPARQPVRRSDVELAVHTLPLVQYVSLCVYRWDDDRVRAHGSWALRQGDRVVRIPPRSGGLSGQPRDEFAALIDPSLDPALPMELLFEPEDNVMWFGEEELWSDGVWGLPMVFSVEEGDLITIGP